jgi:uncharacterized protein YjbI with pentapeptide repeats
VANEEHVALLWKGTAIWNEWRARNPDVKPDFRDAKLTRVRLAAADLNGADFCRANLREADFRRSRLRRADFHGAVLRRANFRNADLSNANLGSAALDAADLTNANLRKADLGEAYLFETVFGNVDLRETVGLQNCRHLGPSIVDFRTYSRSRNLPVVFLRGCGLPDHLIEYLPTLRDDPIEFYSCFISYSARDHVFAEQLHADLQNRGVRCWFASHDLPIGARIWDAIDEAIRLRDKLIVVLSRGSIASDWVEDEVSKAFAKERERNATILFPIRIDDTVMATPEPWAVKLRDQRNIGDFRQWEKQPEYQKSLERLLRDLKANGSARHFQRGRAELAPKLAPDGLPQAGTQRNRGALQ